MIKNFLMRIYLKTFQAKKIEFENNVTTLINYDNLEPMYAELKKSPEIYHPSNLWNKISKMHEKRLEKFGVNNFKRTLITDYSHFPPFPDKSFRRILSLWLKKPSRKVLKNIRLTLGTIRYAGYYLSLNGLLGIYYAFYVRIFYELIRELDSLNLLEKCQEPSFGNPIIVSYENTTISFDQCSSLNEYYEIINNIPSYTGKEFTVGELGAGYGKLAYIFKKIHANCKYIIFDIPPTLYLAQEYLSKVFPKCKMFKFRHFENFSEIEDEFNQSEICFFTSNQLELLPENIINLFINISSLHEMSKKQIETFHNLIDKITKGYFFSKQYPDTMKLPEELSGAYEIPFHEYPIPKNWKIIYKDNEKINPRFDIIIYKI